MLTLLAATRAYVGPGGRVPAITMAMGPLGVVSRLAGETFGSAVTFGTVGAASAPGQVDARALRAVLDLVHEAQAGCTAFSPEARARDGCTRGGSPGIFG